MKNTIKNIRWFWLVMLTLSFQHLFAQPIVLDLEYSSLNFINSNRSVIIDNGNNGFAKGSVHRYNNLTIKNGITVYGLLAIQEINNAVITNFDDDLTFGAPERFQPGIGVFTNAGGYVVYNLQFFDEATDEDIFLLNYCITVIDVDGINSSNMEFIEHGGYNSYKVNNPNQLQISSSKVTGRTRFLGRTSNLSGIAFDNSCSYIIDYTKQNNKISFLLGQTGQNDKKNYSLQFGYAGGNFSNQLVTTNPLLLATDDIGIPVNSNTGGTAVANVLSNDFFNGQPLLLSHVVLYLSVYATHSGVALNIANGAVEVAPGTPSGTYSLKYQICMASYPYDRCAIATVKVKVLEADLEITKSDSPDPVYAGQNITYTINMANKGPTYAQNVQVTDVLPAGLSLISATPSVGSWNGSKWTIGNMVDSTSETLVLVARVNSAYTGTIQNSASIYCTTYDPVTVNNSISQVTTVMRSANLSVTKTDSSDPALAGQNINYTIRVENNGPSDASNVMVYDYLPVGLIPINANVSKGTWVAPDWTIGNLANDSSATLIIEAAINGNLSRKISNTAIVSSTTPDPVLTNNTTKQVTTINASADLEVTKTTNVNPLIAGEMVIYSISVKNNGPGKAMSVKLFDDIPSVFKLVQFSTNGGLTWDFWESWYSLGNMNAGDSIGILIRGSLNPDVRKNSIISNIASVISDTPDPNTLDNSFHRAVIVNTRSDISVDKTGPTSVVAGKKIIYSLKIRNTGPSYSDSLLISDTLQNGISNAEYSMNNGNSWEVWGGSLMIPFFGFSGILNILIRGDVLSGITGNLLNKAFVASATIDSITNNNIDSVSTVVTREADLILSKVETFAPLQKNGQVKYLISVLNNGPSDASGVIITDSIDQNIISGAQYFNGSAWVAWTGTINIGTLKNDSTAILQIRGTITNNATDTIENTASIVSSVSDPYPSNNVQTIQNFLGKVSDISVVNNGPLSVVAGAEIQYSINVTNNSSDTDAENVLVIDYPDNSKTSNHEYSTNGDSIWLSWNGRLSIDTLGFGDSYTFYIRCDVLSNASGILANTVQVSSSIPDTNTVNNSSAQTTTITTVADVSVTKSVLTSSENIFAGSIIDYLIVYRNNGPSDAPNLMLTDSISDNLTNVEFSHNGFDFVPWDSAFNDGNIVAGGTSSIIIRGRIAGGIKDSIFNTVYISSDAFDSDTLNNSSQVSTPVKTKADLKISLSGLPNPVIAGETFSYLLLVENCGPSDAMDIDINSVIPTGLLNTQFSINGGSSWAAWTGSHHLDTLVSGDIFSILISSDAQKNLTNGSLIGFSSSVACMTVDLSQGNNFFATNSTVQTLTDLAIYKLVDIAKPSMGDQVRFTLSATNYGPSDALSVSVTDLLQSGYSYISDNGSGAYNPATGIWTIGNISDMATAQLEITAILISSGNYFNTAFINGEDEDPNYMNNLSSTNFTPDVEAVYSVASAQNVDTYTSGQQLATVTDSDGSILSAILSLGTMPEGIGLNAVSGMISVIDSTLLHAGEYTFTITTVDVNGGITLHPLTIIINHDFESAYNVASPKNHDDYSTGETLATVSDANGMIISSTIVSGTLPQGLSFNIITGEILVENASIIVAGNFSLTVKTIDGGGGTTTQLLTIVINPDIESQYIVAPPKLIGEYLIGDTLAYVTDGDGDIISAVLFANLLPNGSVLNTETGEIIIVDPEILIAGTYRVRINTLDADWGISSQVLVIVIENGIGSEYTIAPPRNVDSYKNGDTLAFVTNDSGEIISAKIESGSLPPGTGLNLVSGEITVADFSHLISGSFQMTLRINGVTLLTITIDINPDIESVYTVELSKNLFSYINGEILATVVDEDGPIISSVIQSGTLPAGIALNPVTGQITVSNASLLEGATNSFSIITTDTTGGETIQPVTISFLYSDLAITKTCSSVYPIAGENLIYTISVINNGPYESKNVIVTDSLPSGLTYISSSPSVGSWSTPKWTVGTLASGSTATLQIEAKLNSDATVSITNTASVSSSTSDPVSANNRATQISPVKSIATLNVNMTGSPDPVTAGDNITYTITVTNNGPSDATNIVVTDDLPANLNFVGASNGGVLTGNQVRWVLNGLQSGVSKIFTLVLSTKSNMAYGSVIANRVGAIGNNTGVQIFSDFVYILVKTKSNLIVQKTTSSASVNAGENITYTIVVSNNGPSDAPNVSISDTLSANVTFVRASANGTLANGTVTWLPGDLTKGENYSCTVEVMVKGNVQDFTVITNRAIVNSVTSEKPVESNNVDVNVENRAVFNIAKTASAQLVTVGDQVTYSISINNAGPSDAINVLVTDTLPSGLTYLSASGSGIFANGVVKWVETKLSGGSNKTYSVDVRVNNNVLDGTVIRNRANVESDNSGGKVVSVPVDIAVNAKTNLVITKSAAATVISGDYITYSIHIVNDGTSDAPNVIVTDVLPLDVDFVSASNGGLISNGIMKWNLTSLVSGTDKTFTLVVKVDENTPGGTNISNTASVICDISDVPIESNRVITNVIKLKIFANDDVGSLVFGVSGGTVVENVLGNDFFESHVVNLSEVSISQVSSSSQQIVFDIQSGAVGIKKSTPAGSYQLIYRICLKSYPDVCDEATVTITVLASDIKATNDFGTTPIDNEYGGVAIKDVTANDSLNGESIEISDIILSVVSPASATGVTLNSATGELRVEQGTKKGVYEITYRICEVLNPTNCDQAVANITVSEKVIEDCDFLVPTGFSPNNDGIHDYFMIKCIEKYPDASLEVFNRWGNLVYKKDHYGNVDVWGETNAWWAGFSNQKMNLGNEKLPPGTYFFILKLNSGAELPVTGSVFLNR